jgi:RNA polymerase sporulation-specific sigma factor
MAKNIVEITGIDTNKLKVLSHEEMVELFKRYQQGDIKAKEELISGNLKLVLSIVKKFSSKVDNLDDLFQVGVIGLIKAIDNFDLSYNLKLSTYACPMISGEIRRYLRDNNMLRVSRSLKDLAYKAMQMKEFLTNKNGYIPTYLEIAKMLNVTETDVLVAIESTFEPVSLYTPIYNDGGDTIYLFEQIEDKKNILDVGNKLAIDNAINSLSAREKDILSSRYIIGKTQMEISEELGISQAQVSRIESGAIKTLKKILK